MRTLILIALCAAVAGGCVSKGKYTSLKADYERLIVEHTELATTLKQCEADAEPPPPPKPPGSNR